MAVTLAEAKAQARAQRAAGDAGAALATLDHTLAAQPLDDELRLEIAATLAALGQTEAAGESYRALSMHLVRAGRPLPALVAAYALGDLGLPFDFLLVALAEMYAAGSASLAWFAARPAPIDAGLEIPAPREGDEPLDRVIERATRRATDFTAHPPYQDHVHPIPFLSELAADSLQAVLLQLRVRRIEPGAPVVQQGELGRSLFLVALGQLRVATTITGGSARELARLHEGSLFGEMALVTSQPRGASVVATEPATVLELERGALELVRTQIPSIGAELTRFTRERLIRNLLATSPLFTPFTKDQQADLLRRFEGVEVELGTTVIREGEAGQGLYVILTGELEVVAHPAGALAPIHLAQLGPGEICGEMSLVSDRPTSATVRAIAASTLLFLPRIYVDRLAEAVPEVRRYFAGIAERRASDNSQRLGAALPEEIVDLDDSDQLLI